MSLDLGTMKAVRSAIRTVLPAVLALAFWAGAASWASAQTYPSRPIKVIVPYPPGGNTDLVGRLFARRLSDILGVTRLDHLLDKIEHPVLVRIKQPLERLAASRL